MSNDHRRAADTAILSRPTAHDTAHDTTIQHLIDARRHLLLSYVAVDVEHRDAVGALLTATDELLADVAPTEVEK